MNTGQSAGVLVVMGLSLALSPSAQSRERETPLEMRRILANAVCLAEAYPGTAIASDSAGVVSVYLEALGGRVTAKELETVRQLAGAARPAEPAPVGHRNLAIARCLLFAGQPDVQRALGEQRRRK